MNPELKKKWLAALRSGDYTQDTGRLKKDNGFCCLGVLCDISGLGQWIPHPSLPDEYDDGSDQNQRRVYLPWNVHVHSGLTADNEYDLARMNDQRKLTFSQIADYVEENL